MSKYCFSCAWSLPQRLLEGELFQDWNKDVSNLLLSVANVKKYKLRRKNKRHKGVSSTVMVFVAAFIYTNKLMDNSDICLYFAVSKWFQFNILVDCGIFFNWAIHEGRPLQWYWATLVPRSDAVLFPCEIVLCLQHVLIL